MPDDRFLHRRQGLSAKLARLDHLAYRVWTQYLLSADDFGVMLSSPAVVRGDNAALAHESEDAINAALSAICQVGLTERFEHQGMWYLCSLEWQDFQKIRLPRKTYLPRPSTEVLQKCSGKTAGLFRKHPFKKTGSSSRVDHRLTANGKRLKAEKGETPVAGQLTAAVVVALWNDAPPNANLPKAAKVEPHAAAIRPALKEHPDEAWWAQYFGRIWASDFLVGRTPRDEKHKSWRPDLGWALKPGTIAKVLDGKYDNARAAPKPVYRPWYEDCHHEPQCDSQPIHELRVFQDAEKAGPA
jgi:hypothetical protein